MLTTLVDRVQFRGLYLSTSASQYSPHKAQIMLRDFRFLDQETETASKAYPLKHGHYTGITRKSQRYVSLVISIQAPDQVTRWQKIQEVQTLFSAAQVGDTYHDLTFYDPLGHAWSAPVKVIEGPESRNYDATHQIEFRIKMLVQNGASFARTQALSADTVNTVQGLQFSHTFPLSW